MVTPLLCPVLHDGRAHTLFSPLPLAASMAGHIRAVREQVRDIIKDVSVQYPSIPCRIRALVSMTTDPCAVHARTDP